MEIKEVARWMARLAGADGVVTQAERRVLRKFAAVAGVDYGWLLRCAYAQKSDDVEVEEVKREERLGRAFENFVVSFLADKRVYRLLAWRGDKISNGVYAQDNLYPDLHVSHRMGDRTVEYLIECKYRSLWNKDDKVDLSEQFLRYYRYAKEMGVELFFAIGVGGEPSNPEVFYLIPSRMFNHYHDVPRDRFVPCVCEATSEAFRRYVEHYFEKRVGR